MYKKIGAIIAFLFCCITSAQAKKVKFVVDMGTDSVSTFGMHVMGDFQLLIGDTINWNSGSLKLDSIGGGLYATVVDLPAFAKYEYIFVNGDQGYEVEFVPEPSRVEYWPSGNNSNRWFYLDSMNSDTTVIGGFRFGGNAPVGKNLLRFILDVKNTSSGTMLPRVQASFNNFSNALAIPMYSLKGNTEYDGYAYVDATTHEFYYTGPSGTAEPANGACFNNLNRRTYLSVGDVVLDKVCFGMCDSNCFALGMQNVVDANHGFVINPSIVQNDLTVEAKDAEALSIFNLQGNLVKTATVMQGSSSVDCTSLPAGIYIVRGKASTLRFIKE
jgi:hypothetical protein